MPEHTMAELKSVSLKTLFSPSHQEKKKKERHERVKNA